MSISGPEVAQNLCVAHDNDSEGVDVRGEDDDQGDQFIFLLPSPGRDTVQLGPSNFMFHFVIHGERDRDEEGHYWRNKRKTVLNVIGEIMDSVTEWRDPEMFCTISPCAIIIMMSKPLM